MAEIIRVGNEDAAMDVVAEMLADALRRALTERPRASLIVTGGRTPRLVLPRLAATGLDWARVEATLTDERWVDVAHPDSNEGQARRLLPPGLKLTGLKTGQETPGDALAEVASRFEGLPRPFDAVFLGMGEDGHIASLFPGQPLSNHGPVVAAIAPDGMARLSLTATALLDSRLIVIPVVSVAKAAVLAQALEPGPISHLPVRAILHQTKVPVCVVLAE